MTGADDDAGSAAYCADLVREHDFARYASSLFVSADQRRTLLALYAFNIEISRVRDQVSQPLPGEIRLQWWTDVLAGTARGGVEGSPVATELMLAVRNFNLPIQPLLRLIKEHEFDLYDDPMPTMAALEGYIGETSSALFALAARVSAPPVQQVDHLARHAGLAQGLTAVIAGLPRDASRRQLFLPLQVLQHHGSGIEEVFSGKETPKMRAAINQLLGEARQHLSTAFSLLAEAPPDARPAFLPLALVRRDIARLSRADNDPFVPLLPSRLSTLWTLWRASRAREFKAG